MNLEERAWAEIDRRGGDFREPRPLWQALGEAAIFGLVLVRGQSIAR